MTADAHEQYSHRKAEMVRRFGSALPRLAVHALGHHFAWMKFPLENATDSAVKSEALRILDVGEKIPNLGRGGMAAIREWAKGAREDER